jgi:hypothetical protein
MLRVKKLRRQAGAIVLGVCVAVPMSLHSDSALAGSGGAFVGGLVGGHILTKAMDNDQRRTEAAETQAYQSQQPQVVYQQAPPANSGGGSTQQKLDELDSLAAKGYITQDEYKARRQSILDSM